MDHYGGTMAVAVGSIEASVPPEAMPGWESKHNNPAAKSDTAQAKGGETKQSQYKSATNILDRPLQYQQLRQSFK